MASFRVSSLYKFKVFLCKETPKVFGRLAERAEVLVGQGEGKARKLVERIERVLPLLRQETHHQWVRVLQPC
ncbi:unnamed protein product [Calypogeia fissa]